MTDDSDVNVLLSHQELAIVCNAINNVLYGVLVDETGYTTLMGATQDEVRALLKRLSQANRTEPKA